MPKAIQDAPVLLPGLGFYYEAFLELSSCRQIGMGTGPIPWTAIQEYADRVGIRGQERERFTEVIRAVDVAYLEHQVKELKKKEGK